MIKLYRDARVCIVCGLSGRPVGLICEACGYRGSVPFRLLAVQGDYDARSLYEVAGLCPACKERDQLGLYMFLSQADLEEYQKTLPPRPPLQPHSNP